MRRLRQALEPFSSRDFTLLWVGQAVSQFGDRAFEVALVWLLVGLTGSTVLIGSVLSASYIPTVALLVFGGALADRLNRRGILLASDLLRAAVTALFAALVILGRLPLGALFAFAAFYGLASAFFEPALSALLPTLTRPSAYMAANALRQVSLQVATLAGPALGGLLIARYSVGAALAFDAATFLVAALASVFLRRGIGAPAQTGEREKRSLREDMQVGFRFLLRERGALAVVLVIALCNGVNNVTDVLVPALARNELHLSAAVFGLLTTCFGASALGAAFVMSALGSELRHRALAICGGTALFGAAIAALGLAQSAWQLYLAYLVGGAGFMVTEITCSTLFQRIIPRAVFGRAISVMSAISMSSNPLGFLFAGALGQWFGLRLGIVVGGAIITLLMLLAFALPAVRALDHHPDADASEPKAPTNQALREAGAALEAH